MVATMKVPPTSTAAAASAAGLRLSKGRAAPSAITLWASAQIRRRGQPGNQRAAASTDTAYAVTWVVILGYSFRLFRMKRRIDASHLSSQEPS